MKKEEWFGMNFGSVCSEGDWGKEYRVDDWERVWEEVTVWNDGRIDYSWVELYWGGENYENREFENFEEFKIFYENK